MVVTRNLYDWPFFRPFTVHADSVVTHVARPGVAETVYVVPLTAVAHESRTALLRAVVRTVAGGAGAPSASASMLAGFPWPAAFTATTENVYFVPTVSPLTVHVVVAVEHPLLDGDVETTYPVISAPPFACGGNHDMRTDRSPCAYETCRGSHGVPADPCTFSKRFGVMASPSRVEAE